MQEYLQPTSFIDSDSPKVIDYATNAISDSKTDIEKSIALYYKVRDDFKYYPYKINLSANAMNASQLLKKKTGYCIEKAILLAACGRVVGIPTRLGFAIVKNHIGTQNLEKILKTNLLVFHGYMEFFLNNKWVKATPAFNEQLCLKLGTSPLEFNGKDDSIFQKYNATGNQFMEYIHDYGQFADMPYDLAISEFKKYYGHLFDGKRSLNEKVFYFDDKV